MLPAPRPFRVALLCLVLVCSGSGCARVLYNFGTVEPRVAYRSAQPSPLFLRYVTWRYGVRTIINLRGRTPGYESAFAARRGLALFSFSMSASRPPSQADVDTLLAILRDPERHPVLIHCRNGVDRTGYMVGLYRRADQGWTGERAVREMNRYFQFEPLNGVPHKVVRDGLRAAPEAGRRPLRSALGGGLQRAPGAGQIRGLQVL